MTQNDVKGIMYNLIKYYLITGNHKILDRELNERKEEFHRHADTIACEAHLVFPLLHDMASTWPLVQRRIGKATRKIDDIIAKGSPAERTFHLSCEHLPASLAVFSILKNTIPQQWQIKHIPKGDNSFPRLFASVKIPREKYTMPFSDNFRADAIRQDIAMGIPVIRARITGYTFLSGNDSPFVIDIYRSSNGRHISDYETYQNWEIITGGTSNHINRKGTTTEAISVMHTILGSLGLDIEGEILLIDGSTLPSLDLIKEIFPTTQDDEVLAVCYQPAGSEIITVSTLGPVAQDVLVPA